MSDWASRRTAIRRRGLAFLTAVAVVSATLIGILGAWPSSNPSKTDGVVSDGITVSTDDHPAIANLDPALLAALRKAATEAARDDIEIVVTSGWRSARYQTHLFDQAVSTYGSEQKASRWVAARDASRHVSGEAVDIGRSNAMTWLSRRGAAFGLCRVYRNEPWHFELRPGARTRGCPSLYATPAHDPRMQQ